MIQNHNILQNRFFTGATNQSIGSSLQYVNNYYLNETGATEKIVDSSNIRGFLSNENNQKVVKSYYSFLTASSLMNTALLLNPSSTSFIPSAQFKAIYYDDDRLADSFNNFYSTSILRGIKSNYSSSPDVLNSSIRNQLLDGSDYEFVTQKVFHNYYFWSAATSITPAYSPPKKPFFTAGTPYFTSPVLDVYGGDRDKSTEEKYIEVPSKGEYYFLNVFLTRSTTQMSRMAFDICKNVVYKTINQNTNFSQNQTNIASYNDYILNVSVNTGQTSFDGSIILFPGVEQNIANTQKKSSIINSGVSSYLIQCFVNPNFITDENEYWSDDVVVSISAITPENNSTILNSSNA